VEPPAEALTQPYQHLRDDFYGLQKTSKEGKNDESHHPVTAHLSIAEGKTDPKKVMPLASAELRFSCFVY